MDKYQPTKKTINYCESILSIVDDDIAKTFRGFGYGQFPEQLPLLAQIARNLRALCADIKNPDTQVDNPDADKKGSADGNDT